MPLLMNFASRSFVIHPGSSRSPRSPSPTATTVARSRWNWSIRCSPELISCGGKSSTAAHLRLHPLELHEQEEHRLQPPCAARKPWPPKLHRHDSKPKHKPYTTTGKPTTTLYRPASSPPPFPAGEATEEEGERSRDLTGDPQLRQREGKERKRGVEMSRSLAPVAAVQRDIPRCVQQGASPF
jgi:hypothetical protein